ncbi:MAG: [FeFe] hydrogenase H-cluster radical SAM maturase HydG [Thermodesulfobacteriota bacterium]
MTRISEVADGGRISEILRGAPKGSSASVLDIIAKAREKKGLTLEEAAVLLGTEDKESTPLILETAGEIKKEIYGDRLVLFAPIYLSNFCVNDCEYCGFHRRNKGKRKRLERAELEAEARALIDMGHKRLLLECGEDPAHNTMDYVTGAISAIYGTRSGAGSIRRVNVNIAPPGPEGFKRLKGAGIGTYQLFQETYHRKTYRALHSGPKADYERQLYAHDRAFEAGIDDVGLGVLFGLFDYRFEVLALISHARYLEKKYGVGPHTISVPRLRPAPTVNFKTPRMVGDEDILRIIAVLRLAIPYTGIILSTRETPEIRRRAFGAGVTQASAASSATPGGYGKGREEGTEQFSLEDLRTVDRFLKDALSQKLLPSFCTACYRRGRTGGAFMELARPGDIKNLCGPNAILTFKEYLEDYAPADVKKDGLAILDMSVKEIKDCLLREETEKRIKKIEAGERDLFF